MIDVGEIIMRKVLTAILLGMMIAGGSIAVAQEQAQNAEKVLFIYDETNDSSKAYIEYFREAFKDAGIAYDETSAIDAKAKNPGEYRAVMIYGMVMAFNAKSPVRDWLKTSPDLKGMKVSLLVTANRWFLKDLYKDLTGLLKKNDADVIDAVSTATKKLDTQAKIDLVRQQVARLQ